jgi:VIT1/CCC1 family predicted Fe2+/Mn2+ transporter
VPGSSEHHRTGRTGWLRAAVLGANDGLLSTASLLLGVAAAHGSHSNVLVAGVAALVAGAMSMAAGEYVSVHSQADTEKADLARERAELRTDNRGEHRELTAIYVERGLDPVLARQVADQLMTHDALGAHARDELGISETLRARLPYRLLSRQPAASRSARRCRLPSRWCRHNRTSSSPCQEHRCSSWPFWVPSQGVRGVPPMARSAVRVTFWGALAMGTTAGVGALFSAV